MPDNKRYLTLEEKKEYKAIAEKHNIKDYSPNPGLVCRANDWNASDLKELIKYLRRYC